MRAIFCLIIAVFGRSFPLETVNVIKNMLSGAIIFLIEIAQIDLKKLNLRPLIFSKSKSSYSSTFGAIAGFHSFTKGISSAMNF